MQRSVANGFGNSYFKRPNSQLWKPSFHSWKRFVVHCINLFLHLYLFLSEIGPPLITPNTSMTNLTSASVLVNCSDGFILINGTCRPLCDKLKLYSNDLSAAQFWIQVVASIAGIVFSVVLVISSYVRRKTM